MLTQVSNQVKRCHLPSAPLEAAEQSWQPDPRLAVSPSPGPLRTISADVQGRAEENSQGLALLLAQSSRILQDPPAAASEMPIRIKYTSKDVFQTLFIVTSAFYLVHFSQLWGCGASTAQGCTRARALAFTRAGGAGDIRKPCSSQHLTVFFSLPLGTSSHHFLHCSWFLEHASLR